MGQNQMQTNETNSHSMTDQERSHSVTLPKGEIKDLLLPNSLTASDQLVLVNAISYRGTWKYAFQKDQTTAMAFRLDEVVSWLNYFFFPFKGNPQKFCFKFFKLFLALGRWINFQVTVLAAYPTKSRFRLQDFFVVVVIETFF